ncbi:MAG TPA: 50S ribosomal protein L3 [Ignavibacteriaceae bacterium]|nr:50S ribosomal protein L3 [Ignavibacteriaceae bacterium]
MPGLLGRKIGMSNIYDESGNRVPVTMIQAGPCTIMGIRTNEKHGYSALQIGFGERNKKNVSKPVAGYVEKNNLPYSEVVTEFRFESVADFKIGDKIGAEFFTVGEIIKVRGNSKGKGFQGVMKRHGFGGIGMTTHGQSDRLRAPGSIGASSYPSRVFKGQRMAGRVGNESVTIRNLKIVKIIPEKNLILIKGAVPGPINSVVELHKK